MGQLMIKALNRILDPAAPGRDLLVDQLNDDLASGDYDQAEREVIVSTLIELAAREPDPAVCESLYNLFEDLFYARCCTADIVQACVARLPQLSSACLVHALPIIAYSQLPDKLEILAPFLAGPDPVVRELMSEILAAGNLDYLLK